MRVCVCTCLSVCLSATVSQWEYPAELAQQYYQAYGNETPTAAEGSSPEGAGHKQLGAGEGEGEGEREGGGEDGPPPPKRMARGVYGSWTTVAVRWVWPSGGCGCQAGIYIQCSRSLAN